MTTILALSGPASTSLLTVLVSMPTILSAMPFDEG